MLISSDYYDHSEDKYIFYVIFSLSYRVFSKTELDFLKVKHKMGFFLVFQILDAGNF